MEISDTALRVAWLSLAILGHANEPEQRLCPITYSIHPYDYAVLTPPIHRCPRYLRCQLEHIFGLGHTLPVSRQPPSKFPGDKRRKLHHP